MAYKIAQGWTSTPDFDRKKYDAGMATPPRSLGAPGTSGMQLNVTSSNLMRPAFDAAGQKALIGRLYSAQQDKLRTGAQSQAERLALRSGMSVNGGQAIETENEILSPQLQDLALAQMQAELGVDRDAAEFGMQEARMAEDRRRWEAERAFQKQQYEDQRKDQAEAERRSRSGGVRILGGGGGGSRNPYDAAMGALGKPVGSTVIGGSPGFAPSEMPDGGQLLSNLSSSAPKPKTGTSGAAAWAGEKSSIKPPAPSLPLSKPLPVSSGGAPMAGVPGVVGWSGGKLK